MNLPKSFFKAKIVGLLSAHLPRFLLHPRILFLSSKTSPPQNPYPLYWMVSIPLQLLLAFPTSPLTQKCNSHNLPFSKNGFLKTITYHLFSHISFFHHTQPIILIFSVFLLSKMAHPWPYFFLNFFFFFFSSYFLPLMNTFDVPQWSLLRVFSWLPFHKITPY